MMTSKRMLWTAISLTVALVGCKSGQESAGDKFRKAGDPVNAVYYYDQALAKGKVSKEFYKNYADVNIQLLKVRSADDPGAGFLDELKDTISSLIARQPDPANEAKFAEVLLEVGRRRLEIGFSEGGFAFLQAAGKLSNKPANFEAQANALKTAYLQEKLKEIEDDYEAASDEPTSGILADYKMNKLALAFEGRELPEMRGLWSKIRKLNLNTYLMYDYEGLITEPLDARINKFGVLLAIVKMNRTGNTVKVEAKAYNGTSEPLKVDGDAFALVDRNGEVYKPTAKLGSFLKKDLVNKGDESKAGGLTFKVPADAELHYLEFKTASSGMSQKYLP